MTPIAAYTSLFPQFGQVGVVDVAELEARRFTDVYIWFQVSFLREQGPQGLELAPSNRRFKFGELRVVRPPGG